MEDGLAIPPVSINFSRRNLADPDLAEKIDRVVTESGIPKNLIEIELTETVDEFPLSVMKAFVDELHKRGFSSSIDDFGSANSSMAVLREISFDTVKIDKGFIDHDQNKDLTILDHIIKMALSIGLKIVAEGVEQEAQVKKLQSFGTEVIQGYYYDRPMPEEKMRERLKDPYYNK
jgi:EAL domain-containing protein (putative c-di-GMP-specific phosphodiesterase class I)